MIAAYSGQRSPILPRSTMNIVAVAVLICQSISKTSLTGVSLHELGAVVMGTNVQLPDPRHHSLCIRAPGSSTHAA